MYLNLGFVWGCCFWIWDWALGVDFGLDFRLGVLMLVRTFDVGCAVECEFCVGIVLLGLGYWFWNPIFVWIWGFGTVLGFGVLFWGF